MRAHCSGHRNLAYLDADDALHVLTQLLRDHAWEEVGRKSFRRAKASELRRRTGSACVIHRLRIFLIKQFRPCLVHRRQRPPRKLRVFMVAIVRTARALVEVCFVRRRIVL